MLSAVKLWKSSSISGPSATSKPSERNNASIRSSVRVIGCNPPVPMPRPGSDTSSESAASCCASFASASAARRRSSASSTSHLDGIDASAERGAFGSARLCERLHVLGNLARLAEVLRLGVLERRGILGRLEVGGRGGDDVLELDHWRDQESRKKREAVRASLSFAGFDQAREALACSAIFVKAALSCTARSARTLRSMSIEAFFKPFMNTL